MDTILINIWNEFKKILLENNINYSLSPSTVKFFLKNKKIDFDNFKILLWWKDFYLLKEKSPLLKSNSDFLMPYFEFNNRKIYIDLIVGSSKNKIAKIYKWNIYKNLIYFGTKKNFLAYFIGINKKISLKNILDILNDTKYTRLIVLSSKPSEYKTYENLDWEELQDFEIEKETFKVFKNFLPNK